MKQVFKFGLIVLLLLLLCCSLASAQGRGRGNDDDDRNSSSENRSSSSEQSSSSENRSSSSETPGRSSSSERDDNRHDYDDCEDGKLRVGGICCDVCHGKPSTHYRVCSGHGACRGRDRCECHGDFYGDGCDRCREGFELCEGECLPICPEHHIRANKRCVPRCPEGHEYHDGRCLPVCCGKHCNEPGVCSGHGRCVAPGTCDCDDDWTGQCCGSSCNTTCPDGYQLIDKNCVPVCCGKPANHPHVCSGYGRCVAPNQCQCRPEKTGNCCQDDCEPDCPYGYVKDHYRKCIPLCCNKNATDPQVCNGNGRCVAPNVCQCNGGFSGGCCENTTTTCDAGYQLINGNCVPVCCGVNGNDPNVCSGHGQCVYPEVCRCNSNFTGTCCNVPCNTCPAGFSLNPVTHQCEPICCTYPSSDSRTCGGRGQCLAPNQCQCNGGFFGSCCGDTIPTCDAGFQLINGRCIPVCCNLPANDANVCGAHGQCVAPNVCQCFANWTGVCCTTFITPTCDAGFTLVNGVCVPVCCGSPCTNPQVCSGRGTCVAPNQCQCQPGYTGACCDQIVPPTCNPGYTLVNGTCVPVCCGLACNHPQVCGGRGQCIAPNTCQCNGGFYGNCCENIIPPTCNPGYTLVNGTCIPVCCNLPCNNPQVCGGRGQCIAPNTCQCNGGYFGNCCENVIPPTCNPGYTLVNGNCVPVCCGVPSTDANVCSGRGTCTAPNTCSCNAGCNGTCCENVIPNCNAGYTLVNGTCVPVCCNLPCTNTQVCSGRGVCVAPNQCQCNGGFTGGCCESVIPPTCNAGYQLINGNCVPVCCNLPATDPNVCSGRGICSAPNTCSCNAGCTGTCCENVPPPACNAGYTLVNGTCVPVCCNVPCNNPTVCSGRGTCVAPNQCQCQSGFTGACCDQVVPPPPATCNTGFQLINGNCVPVCCNLPATDPNVCSGRGVCSAPNTCSCNAGCTGTCCENVPPPPATCNAGYTSENNICIPICYGVIGNRPAACSGNGQCIAPDTCQCNSAFTGPTCNISLCLLPWTCYNLSFSDLSACSGNGLCVSQDSCKCKLGFSGVQCETSSTLPPSNCDVGYTGATCTIPICHGVSGDDSDVCSGNGNCLRPDVCSCLDGFEGVDCSKLAEDTSGAAPSMMNSMIMSMVMLMCVIFGYMVVFTK